VDEVSGGTHSPEFIGPATPASSGPFPKARLRCEVVNVQAILRTALTRRGIRPNGVQHLRFQLHAGNAEKAGMVLAGTDHDLEVEAPSEYQGDLGAPVEQRGSSPPTKSRPGSPVLAAEIRLATMFDYCQRMRSMTQGKGSFTMGIPPLQAGPKSIQESHSSAAAKRGRKLPMAHYGPLRFNVHPARLPVQPAFLSADGNCPGGLNSPESTQCGFRRRIPPPKLPAAGIP